MLLAFAQKIAYSWDPSVEPVEAGDCGDYYIDPSRFYHPKKHLWQRKDLTRS